MNALGVGGPLHGKRWSTAQVDGDGRLIHTERIGDVFVEHTYVLTLLRPLVEMEGIEVLVHENIVPSPIGKWTEVHPHLVWALLIERDRLLGVIRDFTDGLTDMKFRSKLESLAVEAAKIP